MSTSIVTGAAGFVGANLVRALLRVGHEVHAVVRPGSDRWRLPEHGDGLVVREVDITDADALHELVALVSPVSIFHLAAHGAYPGQRDTVRMVDVNLRATAALLRSAERVGVASLVVAGSSSEYGLKERAPGEDEPAAPNSDYAVTKLAATQLCTRWAVDHGLPTVVLRLGSVYGAWEEPSRLIPTLLRAAIDGHLPPMADPGTARDFVHVDDVVAAFVTASSAARSCAGEVFNIGSGAQTTLREVVELARSLFGIEDDPVWGSYPSRSWDTTTWCTDPTKAASVLGWHARTGLADGLGRVADWLRTFPGDLRRPVPAS